MDDRTMLELAAKACGYDTSHPWNAERLTLDPPVTALCIDGVSTGWDPLTDDGQALRLAVKLKMAVEISHRQLVWAASESLQHTIEIKLDETDDPYAATRRAIVRAAAEIGRTK